MGGWGTGAGGRVGSGRRRGKWQVESSPTRKFYLCRKHPTKATLIQPVLFAHCGPRDEVVCRIYLLMPLPCTLLIWVRVLVQGHGRSTNINKQGTLINCLHNQHNKMDKIVVRYTPQHDHYYYRCHHHCHQLHHLLVPFVLGLGLS
jgi:hypothetical protein